MIPQQATFSKSKQQIGKSLVMIAKCTIIIFGPFKILQSGRMQKIRLKKNPNWTCTLGCVYWLFDNVSDGPVQPFFLPQIAVPMPH
jgi:hypothetical protein